MKSARLAMHRMCPSHVIGLGLWTCAFGFGFVGVEGRAAAGPPAAWSTLLQKAEKFEQMKSPKMRLKAATLMMKAYKMVPKHKRSLIAASKSCVLRAMLAKKGRDIVSWGKRGLVFAKRLMAGWPNEAHGYFWASVNYGQFARGGGILIAITNGLAGKIERMAIASFRRNSSLHKGAAQRVLGRYYYRLPWPMRNLKKSLLYLEHSYKRFPKHTGNQFYLAETLWAKGYKARAIKLYRKCARVRTASTNQAHTGIRCYKWLRKHKQLP